MNDDRNLVTESMTFHGPGLCHKCLSPLTVIDNEITVMKLNEDGIPITEDTEVRCYGICPNCGYKVNMIRYMGGYIPYTRASLIILRGELKEKIKNERPLGKNPMDKNND